MSTDIAEFRRAARARLLAQREEPDAATHLQWSDAVTRQLTAALKPFDFPVLGFYWPHRREYDPMPAVAAAMTGGVKAALPVVVAKAAPLEYREWRPETAMVTGRSSFGIPHPADGPTVLPDLLLVPLLGFDGSGYRLGYGGGYFDRTLAAYPVRPRTIGVGFENGRLKTIHPQPHDIPMDMVVTEAGIFPTR